MKRELAAEPDLETLASWPRTARCDWERRWPFSREPSPGAPRSSPVAQHGAPFSPPAFKVGVPVSNGTGKAKNGATLRASVRPDDVNAFSKTTPQPNGKRYNKKGGPK